MANGNLGLVPFSAYSRLTQRQNARSNLRLKYYFLTADAGRSALLGRGVTIRPVHERQIG